MTDAIGGPIACCTAAIELSGGSTGRFENLTVAHAAEGGLGVTGSTAVVAGATIDTGFGGVHVSGGHLEMSDVTITNDEAGGVAVMGGSAALTDVAIDGGDAGIVSNGGTVEVRGGVIQNTGFWLPGGGGGVLADAGTVRLNGTRIANNPGFGVHGRTGARVIIGGAVIENNGRDGIRLADLSVAAFGSFGMPDPSQIVGNAGWGINCAGPPAVAMITGDPGSVTGNALGAHNCPGTP